MIDRAVGCDRATIRPGGRTARTREAVLDATVAELVEHGYAGLTIDGVAARADTSRTTIYRRWGSTDGLLVDAIETFAAEQARVPDTGDVDTDLRLWARSIQATLAGPTSGALVRAIFGSAGDTAHVRTLRHRFWLTRAALVRPMIHRAIDRGQLPAGTDPDEVIRHVGAPLYYRLLVLGEPVTTRAADLAADVAAAAGHAGTFIRRGGEPPENDRAQSLGNGSFGDGMGAGSLGFGGSGAAGGGSGCGSGSVSGAGAGCGTGAAGSSGS